MIKFVYFDLGDVVIRDISEDTRWERFKQEVGITPDYDTEFESWFAQIEPRLLIGEQEFNLDFHGIKLTNSTFVDRFEKNESIWPIISAASKRYKVGLLTNTYLGMLADIKQRGLLPPVDWNTIIDSTQVKAKKPDKLIYEIAQQQAGVESSEIFFIDNSLKNVVGAKALGWQTFHYQSDRLEESNQKLLELFTKLA